MKPAITALFFLIISHAWCQQIPLQIQAKRGVFTERLNITGQWIDRISTNINDADIDSSNLLATGKAIAGFLQANAVACIQNQLAGPQTASMWLLGAAIIGGHNNYKELLTAGLPAQLNVTQGASQHGLSIQRSTTDGGAASLLFFKNQNNDFFSLLPSLPGETIGSLTFSGGAADVTDALTAMSLETTVEKVQPDYLSSGFVFNTTDSFGNYSPRIRLSGEGNLLIGDVANNPFNPYKLNVTEGEVRFQSLAGSGNILVGCDNDGVLYKVKLASELYIEDGALHANVQYTPKYKQYYAVITQPTPQTLVTHTWDNTAGEIVWTRDSAGNYTGTLTGSINEIQLLHAEASDASGNFLSIRMFISADNKITLVVKASDGMPTDNWTSISIEIKGWNTN